VHPLVLPPASAGRVKRFEFVLNGANHVSSPFGQWFSAKAISDYKPIWGTKAKNVKWSSACLSICVTRQIHAVL
jgi:hypothetical protein